MRDFGRGPGGISRRFASLLCVSVVCFGLALSGGCPQLRAEEEPARLTVVVFGDSQAQGIAGGLQRLLLEDSRVRVLNRTHPGAALVHGENEWFGPIRTFLAHDKADVAIVMFGANDRLDIPGGGEGGGYARFRSDAWHDAYTARVEKILAALDGAGLKVIWCGNPIARSDVYSKDMVYINAIFQAEAERFGAQYFPLWETVVDDQGHYTAHGKDRDGTTRRMRADDGIHFTAAGYEVIADKLVTLLPLPDANGPPAQ